MSGTLTIHQAGPAMTIQDLGRPGYRAVGLTHGGAADPTALHEGAALLGQDPNSAALEMAGSGLMPVVLEQSRGILELLIP